MKLFVKSILFTVIASTIALNLVVNFGGSPPPPDHLSEPADVGSYKRPVSRFLQQTKVNPRPAADHCNKDNVVCSYILAGSGRNTTCCNNKCIDLGFDDKNCGACKKKCALTETCCSRECVNLANDELHCGSCNERCMPGGECKLGMCDYA